MGYFTHKFAEIVNRDGTNVDFANRTGLGESTVSRLKNGKVDPDDETLAALCKTLPDEDAAELLVAYLADEIPSGMTHLVRVEPVTNVVREDAPEMVLPKLRPSLRAALQRLAVMCRDDIEFADYIETMVDLFDRDQKR